MKTYLIAGLACVAAAALSACAPLQGLVGFNNALLPQLKPIDVKIHTDISCGDMARDVLGTGGAQLTADQAVAIVQFCERRDATQTLQMDPQGGRKALDAAVMAAGNPASAAAALAVPK